MGVNPDTAINNAIRSLYQIVIHIEEDSHICHVIDLDDEFSNLEIEPSGGYLGLFDALYRNIHPEDREELISYSDIDNIHSLLSDNISVYYDCRLRDAASAYRFVRMTFCNTRECESPAGEEYLLLVQDIGRQKEKEKKELEDLKSRLFELQSKYDRLFEENMTDAQTGCLNRKGFNYYSEIVINEAVQNKKSLFVCVLDLNGLKHLNDTFGHGAGDEGIRVVSEAIKLSAPDQARIIRTGGDEFLIIASVDRSFDFREEMENKIVNFLDAYNKRSNNPFEVSASYGYVIQTPSERPVNLDKLIEEADKKMYVMKEKTDPYKR